MSVANFNHKILFQYKILGTHFNVRGHNQPHKYLDLNINLSELRQILCKKIGPARVSGGGGEVVGKFERFFSIRKTYFLQVKNLILVGTLE
ncbi:hypothetical protein APS47_15785 [Leptospira kirschneri serovar Mozdok]|nr:hypothetical protein APS47_15785 [Leptospira kirschneri serovar Mozdok]OOV46993.1 hypothetical protein B1J94_17340 [Leptospira kirschneri serovar Grippotyphosa]